MFRKTLLILAPVLIWVTWQLSLPLNQYTFRTWEAVINEHSFTSSTARFYPRTKITMTEVGGLAPYTPHAFRRTVSWTIDEYGNRNTSPCSDPDVVVMGDSMSIGDTLDDSETVTSLLSNELHHCVRNISGGKLGTQVERLFRLGLHPKWVVVLIAQYAAGDVVELDQYDPRVFSSRLEPNPEWVDWFGIQLSRIRKNMFWNYRFAHGIASAFSRSFQSPEERLSFYAPESAEPHSMIFSSPRDGRFIGLEDLAHLSDAVERFSQLLAKNGSQLVFAIAPQKEELYSDLTGKPVTPYSDNWLKTLPGKSFHYVDLFETYRSLYRDQKMLFHPYDDNHLNNNGAREFVKKMLPIVKNGSDGVKK